MTRAPADPIDARDLRAFHNALRILINLDADEMLAAGAINDLVEFRRFDDDPLMFFIRADGARAAAIWALIQRRQPQGLRVDLPTPEPERAS